MLAQSSPGGKEAHAGPLQGWAPREEGLLEEGFPDEK